MSLLVPTEFALLVNQSSGFITPRSPFSRKNLKGLFFSPENQRYLALGVWKLLMNPEYVKRNLPDANREQAALLERRTRVLISSLEEWRRKVGEGYFSQVQELMEMQALPHLEDLAVSNPIQQLHTLNKDFLLKTSQNIILSPDMFLPRFWAINPETGVRETEVEWDYSAESYADGTWHPEHLFTSSHRNRENPYWQLREVSFHSEPEATGPGHRYNNPLYARTPRTRGQFPRWQWVNWNREYERDSREGLREGGGSDRRVQTPHGYNMLALTARSTY